MRRAALTWVGLLVLLAGCVGVPTSGPVERHSQSAQPVDPGVEIAPVPPAQGAPPALVVEGFLHAMATYQPSYAIARQFLTPQASESWQPESMVEVYAGGFPPQVSGTTVVLTAPLVGQLDTAGSFSPVSRPFLHDFGLVRDSAGEWRISQPPRGLLVSQTLFAGSWVRAEVSFWDVTGNVLVPDPRFVPRGAAAVQATAAAVLSGPSSGIQDAVRPSIEQGPQVSAVTLSDNGVANVELTGELDGFDAQARRGLAAELVWSLSSLESVTGLRVRGNGVPWELGGTAGVVTTDDYAQASPDPANPSEQVFVVREGAIERANLATPDAEPQPLGLELARVTSISGRLDGQAVAAITDGGTRVRSMPVRDPVARVELSGTGLAMVRWTRQGELLVGLDRSRGERLRMVRDNAEVAVSAAGLPVGRIRSLAVAPDGVRVALVIEENGERSLGTAAMVRSDQGIRFVGWQELSGAAWAPSTQPVLDVGWAGSVDLLVLLGGSAERVVVGVDSEGAMAAAVGPVDSQSATQLAVGSAGRAVLRGSDGQTWRFVDEFTWQPWVANVQQVSLP